MRYLPQQKLNLPGRELLLVLQRVLTKLSLMHT